MHTAILHTNEQISDNLLWQDFQTGDNDALSEIMRRYFRSLLQYGTKFTKNKLLIEDTVQDLFLELLERRAYLSTPESVKNYLFKALRNNLNRAVNKNNLLIGLMEKEDNFMIELDNIEQSLLAEDSLNELNSKFNRYFQLLTKRQKEALHLKYYENLSHDEIAVIMDINKQSVSNLLQQSIHILKINWIVTFFLLKLWH
jgi:RNA polymerase sigma factor (sigma-70 family)